MTTLLELRERYRNQHASMVTYQGDVIRSTRRQQHFRPRGDVYRRLLMREIRASYQNIKVEFKTGES